ncbi:tetratricopeptide repeat-containing sulfotransferase family protein [Aeromonas fluvialis]|uniref:tetratricopeptide repeat-containing sulfotransferase family protein n=1 Tax=Aeromonas fluvialis TaxID=591962 RepID=UPI0005A7F24B|nr:tetratricopeptide repeat-containing sulfotransferase family protein [Aeromonas fluvialis]
MSYLNTLRRLADQQQFEALSREALHYWQASADQQVLPLLVLAYLHTNARREAEATLQAAEACRADFNRDAQVDLAGVYCLLFRLDPAIELLEAVLASEAGHSLAQARLAWCRLRQGNYDEARRLYQASAERSPDRLPVWSALAQLHLEAGDVGASQAALEHAIARLEALQSQLSEATIELFTAQLRGLQLEIWLAAAQLARAEQWLEEKQSVLSETDWVSVVQRYATLLAGYDRHSEAEEALRTALKHYPANLELLSQLAEIAQLQGRTMQAVQLLRRCIAIAKREDKPEVVLWVRLSSACLHSLVVQARKAAEKAVALADALEEGEATPLQMIQQLRLQAKNALAQVESQEQHYEQAENLFTEILTDNPYFLPALQGLGQQQMQRGDIDAAIALFERVKALDPAKGYASLINARQFPEDEKTLERIEKAARQPSLEGAVRSSLLLQLASAWEKRKAYDKAFALAVEANDASKKKLGYDPRAHRQSCARTRYAFCKALYEHRRDCGYRGDDASLPVFVLGMPRSGTTLVEQILASHSQIFGAGELGVIPQRIQGLNRWERHTGSGRHYPDCIDDLNPYAVEGIAKGILEELKGLAAQDKPDARHIVDKLPHNFENVGLIKFLFPLAKIISVRRDPRDIAMSNYFTDYQAKHGGMGFAYDLTWIGEQLADHNLLMHHWQQLFPGEILEINYEDVVENTESAARKMLEYIGVDWEPQVLAFNELDRPVKTASVWQVRQPIYKSSKAKWMRYQEHLAPLIAGTNKKIEWDAIEMLTLPEPGLLTAGVALYKEQKLDDAELRLKKLIHHLPAHAAANFMLGLIYVHKGHLAEGIALMLKAHEQCPWNRQWRDDLAQAYELSGEPEKAAALKHKKPHLANASVADNEEEMDGEFAW